MSFKGDIDQMVVFREFTKSEFDNYEARSNRNEPYYNYLRYKDMFHNELFIYQNSSLKRDKFVQGFWRSTGCEVDRLKKLFFWSIKGCSCGQNYKKWCPHEQLFQTIKFFINSNGVFENGIAIRIMKYLA